MDRFLKLPFQQLLLVISIGTFSILLGVFLIPDHLAQLCLLWCTKVFFYGLVAWIIGEVLVWFRGSQRLGERIKNPLFLVCIGLALAVSLHLWLTANWGYKVLSDEYVITAQSKRLFETNRFDYPLSSFYVYGEILGLGSMVDKRPPSFASILSLVHALGGYRPENAFILNAVIGFIFLGLASFVCARSCAQVMGAKLSVLWPVVLVLSLPLFNVNVTGAGLDLLNVGLIFGTGLLGFSALKSGRGSDVRLWMAFSLLLFYTRYESVLYVFASGAILLRLASRQGKFPVRGLLYLLPFLLIPFLLQARIAAQNTELNLQPPANGIVFGSEYFLSNFVTACEYFLVPSVQSTGSAFIGWLGLVALAIIFVRLLRKRFRVYKIADLDFVLLCYGCVIFVNAALVLFYFWGRVDELEVSRLTLPWYLFLSGLIMRVLYLVSKRQVWVHKALLVLGIGYVILCASPFLSETPRVHTNHHAEVEAWAKEVVLKDSEVPMVISSQPLYWYINDIASMSPENVRAQFDKFLFHFESRSFDAFVLQRVRIDPVSGIETEAGSNVIGDSFHLSTLGEFPYKPYHLARLSKLEGRKEIKEKLIKQPRDVSIFHKMPVEYWFYMLPSM